MLKLMASFAVNCSFLFLKFVFFLVKNLVPKPPELNPGKVVTKYAELRLIENDKNEHEQSRRF